MARERIKKGRGEARDISGRRLKGGSVIRVEEKGYDTSVEVSLMRKDMIREGYR